MENENQTERVVVEASEQPEIETSLFHIRVETDLAAIQLEDELLEAVEGAGGECWTSFSFNTGPAYVVVELPSTLSDDEVTKLVGGRTALRVSGQFRGSPAAQNPADHNEPKL